MSGGEQLAVRLTYAQRHALTAVTEEWRLVEDLRSLGVLPPTIEALIRKGLVQEGVAAVPGGVHLFYRLRP